MNRRKMAQGVSLILEGMGVDRNDDNFKKTPQRVARMYEEMLSPKANNWTTFPSTYKNMVVMRGHQLFAFCPHHLMIVEMKAYVGYIPNERVLGLSKLARAVEEHLTRPIMQEELGDLVADHFMERVKPSGVAVVLAGVHGCMRCRGVRSDGDTVTSAMRGVFFTNPPAREEFMRIIGRP